jgi:hypothetical protein
LHQFAGETGGRIPRRDHGNSCHGAKLKSKI